MSEKERENSLKVAKEIELILSSETMAAISKYEEYLPETSMEDRFKVKMSAILKGNSSKALGVIFRMFETELRKNVFRNEMMEYEATKVDQVDENEILKNKELEGKLRVEKEKNIALTANIEIEKKRMDEMKEFLEVLETNENSSEEEMLIKYLKMN